MLELRDYQQAGLDDLRTGFAEGHKRQILVMPTGSGKTETAAAIAMMARARGNRTWFIVDRKTLSEQTRRRFEGYGLTCSLLQGENTDYRAGADVTIATVQTMRSRLGDELAGLDAALLLIDEVHNLHAYHRHLLDASDLPAIGLTATPHNPALGLYFTRVVAPVSVQNLQAAGFLVPFRVFAPSEVNLAGVRVRAGDFVEEDLRKVMSPLCGDVVTHWVRLADRRPTIAFCVNVQHARELAQQFTDHGITAGVVVGGTPDEERAELYDALRCGRLRVLCSVMVLGTGFDLPECSCAILARPTASEALHIQQCGRVARPAAGKADALILDHAGNTVRHGLPQDYCPPDLDAVEGRTRTERNPPEAKAARCKVCGCVMPGGAKSCPECGTERRHSSEVQTLPGVLVPAGEAVPDVSTEERAALFAQWLGHFTQKKYRKPRGAAALCYRHYFEGAPWDDGLDYHGTELEPPGLDAVRKAENWRKHSMAKQRGQKQKALREVSASLPVWSGETSLSSRDCDHRHFGIFRGTGQHAAQKRCTACGYFEGWIAGNTLIDLKRAG